jgi:glucosamine-6-phosphate deaminase
MNLHIHPDAAAANRDAAEHLAAQLVLPATRSIMVAAGNTPLELYRLIAERRLDLSHLNVFVLDEYVAVPLEEPRNCANLLRRFVRDAWGIPASQFHVISSLEADALANVREHERRIASAGGLDLIILGLGQNGHLGFNEPGSEADSIGRLLELESVSVEANRKWFEGRYAPSKGITVGLKTILEARHVLILAYGPHKTSAVRAMVDGPRGPHCPASFLQTHSEAHAFLDQPAAADLSR